MEVDHFYPTLTPLLTHFMALKVWRLLQMAMSSLQTLEITASRSIDTYSSNELWSWQVVHP